MVFGGFDKMMTDKAGPGISGGEISPDVIRVQLRKMLSSDLFARSERMSRFLSFTVEQYLVGNAANLKEYLIGVEVFDKPETLDPRLDPIVRVEAGRLRAKLREYYETDGREDPICVHFPPRSYVPAFQRRQAASISSAPREMPRPAACDPSYPPSVAVLPFADLSRGHDQEFLCDGLTEDIISALAQIRPLRVVSRTSSFQYKGKVEDIRHIGEQLNVRSLLEGSVRCYDNRLRITAQLVDASDGYHIWSETFDRTVDGDPFTLQREISGVIARRMQDSLTFNQAA
jgi:TolB-like protein